LLLRYLKKIFYNSVAELRMNKASTGGRTYWDIVVLAPKCKSPRKLFVNRFISKSN